MNGRTLSTREVASGVRRLVPVVMVLVCFAAELGHGRLLKSSNASTKHNSDAELQCVPVQTDSKVIWFKKGGSQIDAQKDKYKYVIDDGNFTLTILKVGEPDIGEYVCQVQGGDNYTVEVFCEPFVKHFEKSKNLIQGNTLELTCNAWGWPTPSITWYGKDGVPITSNDRTSFENVNSLVNATLKIKDVTLNDYMEYTCSALSGTASANATILVRVKDKLAPLWPFLGIVVEIIILIIIIIVYEKRRAMKAAEEARKEEAECLTNSTEHKDVAESARLRKKDVVA